MAPKARSEADMEGADTTRSPRQRRGSPKSWDHAVTVHGDVILDARPPEKSAMPYRTAEATADSWVMGR